MVSDARSVDISMGGVLLSDIESMLLAAARSYVDVVIQLPGDPKPIRAMALTVWWQGPYQAFRFVKMSEPDRLRLAEHIDRSASEPAPH